MCVLHSTREPRQVKAPVCKIGQRWFESNRVLQKPSQPRINADKRESEQSKEQRGGMVELFWRPDLDCSSCFLIRVFPRSSAAKKTKGGAG